MGIWFRVAAAVQGSFHRWYDLHNEEKSQLCLSGLNLVQRQKAVKQAHRMATCMDGRLPHNIHRSSNRRPCQANRKREGVKLQMQAHAGHQRCSHGISLRCLLWRIAAQQTLYIGFLTNLVPVGCR